MNQLVEMILGPCSNGRSLTEQRDSGEDELAHDSAEGILSALEARVEKLVMAMLC